MVDLLDLPEELLMYIVCCLHATSEYPLSSWWVVWPKALKREADKQSKDNARLLPLIATCHRLREIVTPLLYRQVSLNLRPRRLTLFTRRRETAAPSQLTREVTGVTCDDTAGLLPLFKLPNIQAIAIDSWNVFHPLLLPDNDYGNSSVRTLRFSNCDAPEDALTDLLRHPRALKELALDTDQDGWHGRYSLLPRPQFNTAALVRAMSAQAKTLQVLTLTHAVFFNRLISELEMNIGPRVDLKNFNSLKRLNIAYDMLVGTDTNSRVYGALPHSLEILQVVHDTYWSSSRMLKDELLEDHEWLTELTRVKPEALQNLTTVIIGEAFVFISKTYTGEEEKRVSTIVKQLEHNFAIVGVTFSVVFEE